MGGVQVPEMQRAELTATVLQLKALGVDNIMAFDWLAPPPAEAMVRALELLHALGALGDDARWGSGCQLHYFFPETSFLSAPLPAVLRKLLQLLYEVFGFCCEGVCTGLLVLHACRSRSFYLDLRNASSTSDFSWRPWFTARQAGVAAGLRLLYLPLRPLADSS